MRIRYGTRGSALALAQSERVAEALRLSDPSLEVERVVIQTSGDLLSRRRPLEAAPQGDRGARPSAPPENVKALFVKEIEEALLAGSIDFAVHSSKDLPGSLPERLCIAAFPVREDPRDAYIGRPPARSWKELRAGQTVATTSPRRQFQLQMAAPGVRFVPMRGNVDTRLRKLREGAAAGLVLAVAGLRRLNLVDVAHEALPPEIMVPAPGQGALALEAREDRPDILRLLSAIDHAKTRLEVECERTFLRLMGGGCRSPLGANAVADGGRLRFAWFWADEEGRRPARGRLECPADVDCFETKATELARTLTDGAES